MRIENSSLEGRVNIDCMDCGKLFSVPEFRNRPYTDLVVETYERHRRCDACTRKQQEAKEREESQQLRVKQLAQLEAALEMANVPKNYTHDRQTGKLLTQPLNVVLSEYIWKHRHSNLLISGITGTYKSTSACFVLAKLLNMGGKIRYTSSLELYSEYAQAKKSDHPKLAAEKVFSRLAAVDLVVVDEFVSKAKVTETSQEFLFELLEQINSGEIGSRFILLGNFYPGSIEDTFSDPLPVRRRLQENFKCIATDGRIIKELTVYNPQNKQN